MNTGIATASLLALKDFTNEELSVFHLAISTWGSLSPDDLAFDRAVEAQLVKPSGGVWDREALEAALAAEVQRRVDAGEWT